MKMPGQKRCGGFVLPAAIFLLVVLSALAAFIVNVSTSAQIGTAMDVQGERAWQAANAGMEWARYQLAINPASPTCPSTAASLSFANTVTLKNFYATVQCNSVAATDVEGVSTWVFEVIVTACSPAAATEPRCPGNPTDTAYVERQLQGLVSF